MYPQILLKFQFTKPIKNFPPGNAFYQNVPNSYSTA